MKPEEACVQGICRLVSQERALLETILEACCGDPNSEASHARTGRNAIVSVPPVVTSASDAEAAQHRETLSALREAIEQVDIAVRMQLDRVKDQYEAAYNASARAWAQTVGDATRKLQASEAAFERARIEAEGRFERDRAAMDHLRARDLQAVRAVCAAPPPARRPTARQHQAQSTHLLTKKLVPPRCYQAADDILQWLQTSGRSDSHAAGRAFELTSKDGPTALAKVSQKDRATLHLALTSTPAAAWPSLREDVARMLSTMVTQ